MNLAALIEKCLRHDRSAQRQLYESYKDNLYTIAYRLCGDASQSSDILQDTFIDAFKSLHTLKEPLYFHSWIKQILVRKTYAFLNKRKKEISTTQLPEIIQEENVDIGYIEQAIQTLPAKSRMVFVMAEIEGLSHKEIGQAMDISVGTSKSQLNYAKTKLKEILKPILHA